jgi:serine/threonine protein kinase
LANFYSESKTPDDDEIRNTFQQLARAKEASGPVRPDENDEINRFLRRHCAEIISAKRAQELTSISIKMGLRSLGEFGKYLETDRPKNQDLFALSGCEYLSIATALVSKELYSTVGKTFQLNESDVFDIQPLRVSHAPVHNINSSNTTAVLPGMFTGFTLQENSSTGVVIRKKVCIKTQISSHERDLVMEVKMFEEASHSLVAGVVEYLASGMATSGPYLITEHFGMSLTQYLTLRIPSMMDRINLFTEICVSVCSLHAVGLMHGALTPDHILISDAHPRAESDVDGSGNTSASYDVKLCNLLCCRHIGDSFPINATNELKVYPGGYVAPEVYFGRVGVCRATTKIDAFTLSLIGYHLLNRKPSVTKHLFPTAWTGNGHGEGEGESEELKRYLKDQERINDMIFTDLDSPLSDIISSVCQLNPGERCDIETVVNMLQIRNSDIQSDLTSLMSLGDMYDELFAKLLSYLLDIKQFLVFDSGGYSLFLSLATALRILTGNINIAASSTPPAPTAPADSTTPPPAAPSDPSSLSLTEFHQHLATFLGYLRKRGYTDNPLSPRLSLEEPHEFPEELLLNKIISVVEENQFTASTSAIKEKITSLATQLSLLETDLTSQRTIVCLFGDAIGRCLSESTPRGLSKSYRVLESRDLWMDDVTREQCDELQNSILKMNASLLAVKNINRGLVRFMSNELSNLQKTYFDLVRRCYSVPIFCILLPCLHSSAFASSDSVRLKKHTFRLQFLCSHTHQLLPGNVFDNASEITVTLDSLSRECIAPVVLTCLTLLRTALRGNPKLQQTLIPGLLPSEITDPSCQLPFLDLAYHLLHTDSIYSAQLSPTPSASDAAAAVDVSSPDDFVEIKSLREVASIESTSYPPVILTPDIAKFSYQKITTLIKTQNPHVDLAASGSLGLRLVASEKKKFGWIIDSDDIETRYLRGS